jgi:hypothetical protein
MKRKLVLISITLGTMLWLTGCIDLHFGGGSKSTSAQPSLGQQLVDLKKARDTGALTEAEYQCQRAKLVQK